MSLELKQPSEALMKMVNLWTDCYITSTELPIKILEAAKKEGLTKQEIRKIVEDALVKRGLSERRIREVLPAELKDSTKIHPHFAAKTAAEDKNDHGNELHDDYIPRPAAYTKEAELVLETGETAVDVKAENIAQKGTIKQLREVIAKMGVESGDKVETNFERLFEMLPGDDTTTYKNKEGGLTVFTELYLKLRSKGIRQLQWWVRVIK